MSRGLTEDQRTAWSFAAGGAALLTIVFASQLYVWVNWWPVTIGWGTALVWSVPQLLVWGLLIPLVTLASRHVPIGRAGGTRYVLMHVVFSVAIAFTGLAILDVSDRVVHWSRAFGAPSQMISSLKYTIIHLHMGIAVYWVTLAADHAFRFYARSRLSESRASGLESQLTEAKLLALRSQLHPHFLFNTLNSIAVLMRRDVDAAERMLHRLSHLLRVTLDRADAQLVTLEEELEYIRSYVAIESERFRDRLVVHFDVDPEALSARIPNLFLQPLVENAIHHGVAPRAKRGHVEITAHRRNGALTLSIWDDGDGINETAAATQGVGLSNTRRRLTTLYGNDHRFELTSSARGGTEVVIVIPFDPGDDQ